jgi:hypothetical protein
VGEVIALVCEGAGGGDCSLDCVLRVLFSLEKVTGLVCEGVGGGGDCILDFLTSSILFGGSYWTC